MADQGTGSSTTSSTSSTSSTSRKLSGTRKYNHTQWLMIDRVAVAFARQHWVGHASFSPFAAFNNVTVPSGQCSSGAGLGQCFGWDCDEEFGGCDSPHGPVQGDSVEYSVFVEGVVDVEDAGGGADSE